MPKGRDILYGKSNFFVIKKEIDKVSKVEKNKNINKNYNEDMYLFLKRIRKEIATTKKVPPYIIFSDKSLKDMCIIKPIDNYSFLRVHGVGERKLLEYGPLFIPKIKEFLGY